MGVSGEEGGAGMGWLFEAYDRFEAEDKKVKQINPCTIGIND